MKSAMIGMGEVGCMLFEALSTGGLAPTAAADKNPSSQARTLCHENEVALSTDAAACLPDADLILSCVEGETVASIVSIVTKHGHAGQVLIDFSTASADIKKEAATTLASHNIDYVDVAIMGAIALTGSKTRMIAAGVRPESPSSEAMAQLQQVGLMLTVINDSQAGDAISLKLLRSIFTKGLEALTTECLAAAEHLGVRQSLYEVLTDVDQTPLPDFLEMLVCTHVVHASRRKKEVGRAQEQLQTLGLDSLMLPAVSAVFDRTEHGHDRETTPVPPSPEAALMILIQLIQQTQQKKVISNP